MTSARPPSLHYLWLLAVAAGIGVLLYLLSPILSPFLFAAILAYICDPLVDRLERRRVPRAVGTVLVLLLVLGVLALLLLILLPLIFKEGALLAQNLPGYLLQLKEQVAPWLLQHFGIRLQFDVATLKQALSANIQGSEGIASRMLASLKIGGLALAGFFVNLLLVPVVLFYLLRDWDGLVAKLDQMVPRRWHARVTAIAQEVDAVLAEFLRGQIAVMLLMSLLYVLGLWLVGLEFALPIGILTGMLVFVPYVGMIAGLTLATLAALMQFQTLGGLIPVWIVFAIGQVLEGMVVTPWLVGERTGLHPLAVIFALLAFGQVFGFVGVLLALPASAALLVGLRHMRKDYLESRIYNE